jgi:hypothetical protein
MTNLPANSDEYVAVLKRLGADPRCPSCSDEKWHVAKDTGGIPYPLGGRLKGEIVVHVATCIRCGFVRQHSPGALARPPEVQME